MFSAVFADNFDKGRMATACLLGLLPPAWRSSGA